MRKGICLTLGLVFLLLLLTMTTCITATGISNRATIVEIIEAPSKFEGNVVIIGGEYSWKHIENAYDPPVTPTDWIIKDDTGWIYVTGENPSKKEIGYPLEVRGIVKVTDEGTPYIQAQSIKIK
jgi:hypothetical protein